MNLPVPVRSDERICDPLRCHHRHHHHHHCCTLARPRRLRRQQRRKRRIILRQLIKKQGKDIGGDMMSLCNCRQPHYNCIHFWENIIVRMPIIPISNQCQGWMQEHYPNPALCNTNVWNVLGHEVHIPTGIITQICIPQKKSTARMLRHWFIPQHNMKIIYHYFIKP